MPAGVHTNNLRFVFAPGWLTGETDPEDGSVECGELTPFALEVTGETIRAKLDKIAEIYYRARLTQITEITLYVPSVSITFGLTTGTISPLVMYSASGGLADNFLRTGYTTLDAPPPEDPPLDPPPLEVYPEALPYLGEEYTENYVEGPGPTVASGVFRDILGNEIGIFLPFREDFLPTWNPPLNTEATITTAFTWYSFSAAGTETQPDLPIPWISDDTFDPVVYESLEMDVFFGHRVAVIYGGSPGDIFHPENRFFLEMKVVGKVLGAGLFFQSFNESGFSLSEATYTMRLSSGDLTIPLCSTDSTLAGDIVHQVIEWFPYQSYNPAAPVWDSATGAKL